ncbi:MAG: ComF family protein [Chitinophagaceae bacterium]|nr:ComF family protein [Chitinophagaceae bacterium]
MLLQNPFQSLSNLFFPRLCVGCGNDLFGKEKILCLSCIDKFPVTNFHFHANNPVEKIFWGRLPLAGACSYLYFTKNSLLQHLLHAFKYKGNKEIGYYFGRCMGESFIQSNRFKHIDALIPLPLHPKKEKRRGYNQAAVLCDGIAEIMQIPVLKNAVVRPTSTQTQTHKNRIDRWQNIEGKFLLAQSDKITNKHVLLVDDVITTGATLEACGHELLKSEGVRLSIATLAYTSR